MTLSDRAGGGGLGGLEPEAALVGGRDLRGDEEVGEAVAGRGALFDLPGGGTGRVCSKRDSYPDGRSFVGAGIHPQLRVSPRVADLQAGRDTVLEAALDLLRR